MRTTAKKREGFTLIELICVILIIGVLVSVSVPRMKRSLVSLELNSAAGQLKSVIEYLHYKSVVDAKIMQLSFDPQSRGYATKSAGESLPLKSYKVPGLITIEAETKELFFYPDGSIGKTDIALRTQEGSAITLTTKGVWGGVIQK